MPPKTRRAAPKAATRKTAAKRKPRRKIVTVKAKVTITLFKCKRCRRGYNWPFGHVCLIGFTPAQAAAARRNLEAARRARKS